MPETPSASETHFAPPPRTGNVWAVLSLICGVASLVLYFVLLVYLFETQVTDSIPPPLDGPRYYAGIIGGPLCAISGFVFGLIGMEAAKSRGGKGRAMAVAGYVLGMIALVPTLLVALSFI